MTEVLVAFIENANNIAITVLMMVAAGLGYGHLAFRKEERQDRREFQRILSDNTQAISELRNMLTILVSQSGSGAMIPRGRDYRRDYERDYSEERYDEEELPTVTRRGRRG